jgi:CHAT domain-containing protein/tetratricopeptide (TPR) repeat protein
MTWPLVPARTNESGLRAPRSVVATYVAVLAGLALSLSLSVVFLGGRVQAQEPTADRLSTDRPAIGSLEPGASVRLRLECPAADTLVRIEIDQVRSDLKVELLGPDGRRIVGADVVRRPTGVEEVAAVLGARGSYQLQITAKSVSDTTGGYEARLAEQRPARSGDTELVAAWSAYAQARELQVNRTEIDRAIELYRETFQAWRQSGETQWAASTWDNIGTCHRLLREPRQAATAFRRALPLWQRAGDVAGEGISLINLATAYTELDELAQAQSTYERAVRTLEPTSESALRARALNNLGSLLQRRGRPREALVYLEDAASLRRRIGALSSLAVTLNNQGSVYTELGDLGRAQAMLREAVEVGEESGNSRAIAAALANLGLVLDWNGESVEAISMLRRSVEISRQTRDRQAEAEALRDLGTVYFYLGDLGEARNLYDASRGLLLDLGQESEAAARLVNMGWIESLEGDLESALRTYEEALPTLRKYGTTTELASALEKLGGTFAALGRYDEAHRAYAEALQLSQQLHHVRRRVRVNLGLGRLTTEEGRYEEAARHFERALRSSQDLGHDLSSAEALVGLARVARMRGRRGEAQDRIETAIEIVEGLRQKVVEPNLSAIFFASQRQYYELAIELAVESHRAEPQAGHAGRGFEWNERSRARSLLDLVSRVVIETGDAVVDPDLLRRAREIRREIAAQERYQFWAETSSTASPSEVRSRSRLDDLVVRYREVEAEIHNQSRGLPGLGSVIPLRLASVQAEVLDDDTALLSYFLGTRASYFWVVTDTDVKLFDLPSAEWIESRVRRVREILTIPERRPAVATPEQRRSWHETMRTASAEPIPAAVELSEAILGPALASIANRKTVAVVADGALQYIPFAVLPVPGETSGHVPLLARHEVVRLPSASVLAGIRKRMQGRPRLTKTLALIADPVIEPGDERLTEDRHEGGVLKKPPSPQLPTDGGYLAGAALRRLDHAGQEADTIAALVPPDQVLKATGFRASRRVVLSSDLASYRFLHFATHAVVDDKHPELSSLVLSWYDDQGRLVDGLLRLIDVFNLEIGAELVTLSACRTGLGAETAGEGLMGLTSGFFHAGAPRVAASLWPVDDAATSALMKRFYELMLREEMDPVAALRKAQLEMRRQPARDDWRLPYYWGAFEIHGDWR